uniref:Zgc:112185 n=1 Tax=Oryzias latipes TaxID=8090 RepID=A0A3P9KNH8_ORYLA
MEGNVTDQKLLFLDIEAKSDGTSPVKSGASNPLWTRSDNSFKFNFFSDSSSGSQVKTPPSDWNKEALGQLSFSDQCSDFAFNFAISKEMDTRETAHSSSPTNQSQDQEEKPSLLPNASTQSEVSAQPKTKKKTKKKSGTKEQPAKDQKEEADYGTREEEEEEELGTEEKLNRQLDWCIEQLELGLKCQKGTTKQKEEAFRALKTLRSSKAPLAKKRQVMRAMTGDYRKKMEEERTRQFKLIQGEIASAQVKVASDAPKKSVFHRRAGVQTQKLSTDENLHQREGQDDATPQSHTETSSFLFVPSKEEFCFNFF